MNRLLTKLLPLKRALSSRIFAVATLTCTLAVLILTIASLTNAVYIHDGDVVSLRFTLKQNPAEILQSQGITLLASDVVDFDGFSGKLGDIKIKRSFPVYVTADDVRQQILMVEGTVADALFLAGVELLPMDTINLSTSKLVARDDEIIINRIVSNVYTVQETIAHAVIEQPTSILKQGKSVIKQTGTDGKKTIQYKDIIVDGKVTETIVLSETIDKQPKDTIKLVGKNGAAISPMEFEAYPLDENGVPVTYSKVLYGQSATGYSAKAGAGTASGRRAKVGHVAVNPNVIPYGTKLYITSANGKFVYGYCIAADTGTGLLSGKVGVDLFYDTYDQSRWNGLRTVNIYILE